MAGFRFRLELCELEIQFLAFENGLGKGKDGYSRLSMLSTWTKLNLYFSPQLFGPQSVTSVV